MPLVFKCDQWLQIIEDPVKSFCLSEQLISKREYTLWFATSVKKLFSKMFLASVFVKQFLVMQDILSIDKDCHCSVNM